MLQKRVKEHTTTKRAQQREERLARFRVYDEVQRNALHKWKSDQRGGMLPSIMAVILCTCSQGHYYHRHTRKVYDNAAPRACSTQATVKLKLHVYSSDNYEHKVLTCFTPIIEHICRCDEASIKALPLLQNIRCYILRYRHYCQYQTPINNISATTDIAALFACVYDCFHVINS